MLHIAHLYQLTIILGANANKSDEFMESIFYPAFLQTILRVFPTANIDVDIQMDKLDKFEKFKVDFFYLPGGRFALNADEMRGVVSNVYYRVMESLNRE